QQVEAAARAGADVAILDDAFQHRRAARIADVVLLSADRWTGDVRLLPGGPFREPLSSLRRASLVVVTVKAASRERIEACVRAARASTEAAVITVDLQAGPLVPVGNAGAMAIAPGPGAPVLAVSGIGDPAAFHAQLVRSGWRPTPLSFPDHHAFDAASVQRIVAASAGKVAVICTLKDAVKLGPQWPSSAVPLWYLSQSVVPRDGTDALDAMIQSVLAARRNGPLPPDLTR
ncbi:MAG TPA: tetraacyldisaccharide 4'-kinase, partial [Gemmatimonadaceae bacterium]|nr:tetraacyldisaccharide 4'-kinase [Gemmatimonadaceae bacterium]